MLQTRPSVTIAGPGAPFVCKQDHVIDTVWQEIRVRQMTWANDLLLIHTPDSMVPW